MGLASQRVDINLRELYDLFVKRSLPLYHEKATRCPCLNSDDQQAPNCPICLGTGRAYQPPVLIQGIVSGIGNDVEMTEVGLRMMGTVYITARPETRLSFQDRLTLKQAVVVYSELVRTTGPGTPVKLRYPIEAVEFIMDMTTTYNPKTDYNVVNNQLSWNITPPDQYSVRYLTYPRWLILNFPHILRGAMTKLKQPTVSYVELPIQALAKLEFRVTNEDFGG